jgi:hypothetical protein
MSNLPAEDGVAINTDVLDADPWEELANALA